MDKSRFECSPGVWLDYRRALFLEESKTLCVADLHLGYNWAHRNQGQLMPIAYQDPILDRLMVLIDFYKPESVALLGDIVHRAAKIEQISRELASVVEGLSKRCELKLIAGNHDKKIQKLLDPGKYPLLSHLQLGRFLLVHGDKCEPRKEEMVCLMGHEHPAISLGDGVKSAKFPCFLVGTGVIVLPAFSNWAAGTAIQSGQFMSELARGARFDRAFAILGEKLLPVRLGRVD